MKQQKIKELSSLARSKSDIEDLTEKELEFYDKHKYRKSGPVHVGIIANPTKEQEILADSLGEKIHTHTIFVNEHKQDEKE